MANPQTVAIRAGTVTAQRLDTGQPVHYEWDPEIDRRIRAQALERDARARMDAADWDGAEELL